MKGEKELYVISHTHWDREWYEVFQEYRMRLVRMIDRLLDLLETDPSYACFHLDGQTIVLEDYLDIRPQNRGRLARLIREGRLLIGPWYVMPDEFLVSGESLVRNLQIGFSICREYGAEPMPSGYVPDLFGHNNQFPQILRGFGLDNAVLFRGIADYGKDAFRWRSPDGSSVTAFKLCAERAYSNFYFAVRWPFEGRAFDPQEAAERLQALLSRMEPAATSRIYLMMDGVDHIDAEEQLPSILESLRAAFPDLTIRHASWPEFLRAYRAETPALEELSGPLYQIGQHGMNNRVLKNVLSSVVHNKQNNDACERLLTGTAEPLLAFLRAEGDAAATENDVGQREDFLRRAWKTLIQNHPHDSICGCSVTDVHEDMEYRFRQVKAIGGALVKNMGDQLGAALDTRAHEGREGVIVVYNASQAAWNGVTLLQIPVPEDLPVPPTLFDCEGRVLPAQWIAEDHTIEHRYPVKTLIQFEGRRLLTCAVELSLPSFGCATLSYSRRDCPPPGPGDYAVPYENPRRVKGSLRTAPLVYDTGCLEVAFCADGTLDVLEKASGKRYSGLLRLEDGGDLGDGYEYRKPLADTVWHSTRADVAVLSDGPLAAILRIRVYIGGQQADHEVTLTKGSDRLDVRTTIRNTAANHRLRLLFPTFCKADDYHTKTPYAMTRWPVEMNGWENAREEETFVRPSQGVTLLRDGESALAVYAKGLYEVSVSEDASRTLALTLFRAFPNQVASLSSELGRMNRTMTFETALQIRAGLTPAQALTLGEQWRADRLCFAAGIHPGVLPGGVSFLDWRENTGLIQSSYTLQAVSDGESEGEAYVLRAYDASGEGSRAAVVFPRPIRRAFYVDFRGKYLRECAVENNRLLLEAAPSQIISAALRF